MSVVAMAAGLGPTAARADDDLAPLYAKLAASNVAVLEESLANSNVELVTSDGSANDALWSDFATRGWMTASNGPSGGPVGVVLKVYTLTPEGQAKIPAVLRKSVHP